MAHDAVGFADYPARRFDGVPRTAGLVALVLVVLGAIAFVAALATDATRAWRAYLHNWLFFTSLASGATLLATVVIIARGLWSQPIRRIALSFVAFLPVALLLLIPLVAVSGHHIFPWEHHFIPEGKRAWLNAPFAAARNVLSFALFVGVALAFAYWSLRPDLGTVRETAAGKVRGLYERMTRGWRGAEHEEVQASHKTAVLAPVLVLCYVLALTIIAFDYVMSLEPEFKSTLIGAYFFMSAFLGGVAATTLVVLSYRPALQLEEYILPENLHDLGKLHFALNAFWAYMLFAQLIVIWYGLLPSEQSFLIRRFAEPYQPISILVLFCLFVIPFFTLLGVKPKKTPAILGTASVITLLGLWIERWLLVFPSLYPQPEPTALGWQEIGTALLFGGLLLGSILVFAARFPLLQLWRPMAEIELLGHVIEDPTGAGIRENA